MTQQYHDSPKEPKRRHPVVKRLLSPKSSLTGLALIIIGAGMLHYKLDATMSIAVMGGGLILLGVKDKK